MRALSCRSRGLSRLLSWFVIASLALAWVAQPARAKAPAPLVVRALLHSSVLGLYTAEEALRDALSSPLEYVGTGRWPGINRMYTCAFRNERVLVVNVYCGTTDARAFRIDVYSPRRGRVRIYAEASGPILARIRKQYFTFMAESELPPGPEAHMPPLALSMSFAQLRAYDEQRYRAYLPACFGGQEHAHARDACIGALSALGPEWASQNRAFLDRANADWYRVVRELRVLATRYGKDPKSARSARADAGPR